MTALSSYASWIAVDWGTSNLRLWAVADNGDVQVRLQSDKGMSALCGAAEFEAHLLQLASPYLDPDGQTDVVICGMAGARQGWQEAGYASLPYDVSQALSYIAPQTSDRRIQPYILSGVQQESPADVMRGEETQIAGFLASHPEYTGTLCLPGTHTKWAQISSGLITGFSSFMTGELFALISRHSILKHDMPAQRTQQSWPDRDFLKAVKTGSEQPETVAHNLFRIRATSLVTGRSDCDAEASLSGYLIGAELKAASAYWQNKQVYLLGAEPLTSHYQNALASMGGDASCYDAETATFDGLCQAYQALRSMGG